MARPKSSPPERARRAKSASHRRNNALASLSANLEVAHAILTDDAGALSSAERSTCRQAVDHALAALTLLMELDAHSGSSGTWQRPSSEEEEPT